MNKMNIQENLQLQGISDMFKEQSTQQLHPEHHMQQIEDS